MNRKSANEIKEELLIGIYKLINNMSNRELRKTLDWTQDLVDGKGLLRCPKCGATGHIEHSFLDQKKHHCFKCDNYWTK